MANLHFLSFLVILFGVLIAVDALDADRKASALSPGREVKGVSLFGSTEGNVRGAVPSARIAVYIVCWPNGCFSHSVLAAFNDAIADGVDIVSISLGPAASAYYDHDSIAIGAFHAMQKGILTSQSSGNNGPVPAFLLSVAPWVLTVAQAAPIDGSSISLDLEMARHFWSCIDGCLDEKA
ncbi:subtilisin-like protease SBT4.9 [Magnolia sinica]|uniref:subtilisin-like protease SBT4.9 n=1 Tax=Magnolia sinica TaxID=86752 RepID=UPI0026591C9A|nr:subtilisin-like protease SBT4.9 [Magnolia sinica]